VGSIKALDPRPVELETAGRAEAPTFRAVHSFLGSALPGEAHATEGTLGAADRIPLSRGGAWGGPLAIL